MANSGKAQVISPDCSESTLRLDLSCLRSVILTITRHLPFVLKAMNCNEGGKRLPKIRLCTAETSYQNYSLRSEVSLSRNLDSRQNLHRMPPLPVTSPYESRSIFFTSKFPNDYPARWKISQNFPDSTDTSKLDARSCSTDCGSE